MIILTSKFIQKTHQFLHISMPFALIMAFCMLLQACQPKYKVDERQLTVSIEPLRYITEAIAGDCYQVTTLTPEGVSPEAYMPTPQQIMSISQGTAYIYLGSLSFEQQNLNRIVENCPHLYTINVSENISLLPQEGCCSSTDSADPHIWTSVKNMKTIATNIHKALCKMDSANVAVYNQRYDSLISHLNDINLAIHHELDTLKHRTFLINHPSLAYFATQYDLKQISVEKEGKEASAERVAHLIKQCQSEKVHQVFLQKQNSKRTASYIAKEVGADTTTINPLSYRWDLEMLHIAKTLAK